MKQFTIVISRWEEHREEETTYKRIYFPVHCISREDAAYLADILFPYVDYASHMSVDVVKGWLKEGREYSDFDLGFLEEEEK